MALLKKQKPEILEKQIEENFKNLFHVELTE
jgi:hypothetical protein